MNILLLHNRANLDACLLRSFTKLWIWVGHFHKVGLQQEGKWDFTYRKWASWSNQCLVLRSKQCRSYHNCVIYLSTNWPTWISSLFLQSHAATLPHVQHMSKSILRLFLCSGVTVFTSPDRPLCTGHRRAGRRTRPSPPLGSRSRPSPADALCSSELRLWPPQSLQDSWALARQTNPNRTDTDTVLVWACARQQPGHTAVKLV